ncbi:histone PARylation factor 1 [Aricia agestis]|uniref:histone PARylation factor 1 n=1 Tax=Aricia agestis TaxID=91739 RepID=UPI001C208C89|nr:histone PARylation factor 1 [Aricia agestis]
MSDEREKYNQDPRVICKYGEMCYQKNEEHHKKYKHPPPSKTVKKHNMHRFLPFNKVQKTLKGKSADSPKAETPNNLDKAPETSKSDEVSQDEKSSGTSNAASDTQDTVVSGAESNNDEDSSEEECNFSYYHKHTDPIILKELFLVEMPDDFFKFFECLKKEAKKESKPIENILDSVNLQLIGPFDFLMGKLPKMLCKDMYLTHWRFYYDPPEFQSVLKKKGTSQFHIGYFRDDPKEKPVFLAKNDSAKDCIITPISENIFGAVYWYLQHETIKSPFTKMASQKLINKVKSWAEQHKYTIEEYDMKKRQKQIACRTFHGAGIVVPYNKETQVGYRPLVEKDVKIKEMFKKLKDAKTQDEKDKVLAEIQPIITYASIAVDECDFGTGLEAGIALFCSGLKELQSNALKCLEVAYSLLKRDAFKKIIQVHLERRRKGVKLSIL